MGPPGQGTQETLGLVHGRGALCGPGGAIRVVRCAQLDHKEAVVRRGGWSLIETPTR